MSKNLSLTLSVLFFCLALSVKAQDSTCVCRPVTNLACLQLEEIGDGTCSSSIGQCTSCECDIEGSMVCDVYNAVPVLVLNGTGSFCNLENKPRTFCPPDATPNPYPTPFTNIECLAGSTSSVLPQVIKYNGNNPIVQNGYNPVAVIYGIVNSTSDNNIRFTNLPQTSVTFTTLTQWFDLAFTGDSIWNGLIPGSAAADTCQQRTYTEAACSGGIPCNQTFNIINDVVNPEVVDVLSLPPSGIFNRLISDQDQTMVILPSLSDGAANTEFEGSATVCASFTYIYDPNGIPQ